MRTFKQHIKENKVGQFYEPADDNINPAQLSDPEVLRKINAFVGSLANQSYVLPEQAINVIRQKLNRLGIGFGTTPKMEGASGTVSLPITVFGGRFGKDTDTPHDEFLNDDGTKVEGGLSLNISYEMIENNSCKLTARIE